MVPFHFQSGVLIQTHMVNRLVNYTCKEKPTGHPRVAERVVVIIYAQVKES